MASSSSHTKVTIAHIAHQAGVSSTTVSLALRNKPGISEQTRQRVIRSAMALGYALDSANLAPPESVSTIGVLVKVQPGDDGATDQFYGPVLSGIETVCRERHVNLLYGHLEVNRDNIPLRMPRMVDDRMAGGLLIVGIWLDSGIHSMLSHLHVPMVLVDSYAPTPFHDAVLSDNELGMFSGTAHLIGRGHRHIAILGSGPSAYPSILERRRGYERALAGHGLSPYYADSYLDPAATEPALRCLLQQHSQITAIVGCNDLVAINAIQVLHTMGGRVPEDVSVIGYDDIRLAEHVSPALTTMRVDKRRMGRMAAVTLLDRLHNPNAATVRVIIMPDLVERASVAWPPGDGAP